MGGRPSREPLRPADDPARHRRPDPRRHGPDERLRLLLPPERDQARPRRTARAVDQRRGRVQLAAAPPPVDVHAGRLGDRGATRRQRHRVVQRARADAAHEGHARRDPVPGLVARRGPRPAVQSHAVRPDVPVVGQRRGPCPRPLPVVLPARRDLRRRPREARHVHVPGVARPLLRRRLRRASARRGGPHLVPQHPGPHLVHGDGVHGGLLRRLRPRGGGGLRPLGRPPHLAGQEAMDVGQPRVRLRVGSRADRRRRAVCRADGRRLHRQPAGFQLPRSRTRRGPSASAGTRSGRLERPTRRTGMRRSRWQWTAGGHGWAWPSRGHCRRADHGVEPGHRAPRPPRRPRARRAVHDRRALRRRRSARP